jgi:putative PEP-CTERM system TPR-repeat lipoprotein
MSRRRRALLGIGLGCLLPFLFACQPSPEERLAAAEEHIASADYRTAAIELRNLLQARPDDSRGRLLLAEVSYQLGDFAEAASQYERAIGLGETDSSTWVAFGRALLSQGRATEALDRVVPNLDETVANASQDVFIGDVLYVLGNFDEALASYERAESIDAGNVLAIIGQAMVFAARSDLPAAEELLNRAEEVDPASSSVWQARGTLHVSRKEFAEAADAFSRALELETPQTPLAESFATRINLVSSLIDARRVDDAAQSLEQFRERFPDHPVATFLSGRLAFVRGDYDAAQLQLQNYLSLNPGDARGLAILGAVNFSQQNLRQAEANLLSAVRANAGGQAARRLLAETRLRLDDPAGALDILQSASAAVQSDSAYLSMLGRAQVAAGDEDAAIESFRSSLEQNPDDDAVRLSLASTYLQANMADSAIDLLDAMPARPGSALRRHTLLVAALLREGDRERAIAESQRMLDEEPDNASVLVVAGALWQTVGNLDKASAQFEKALELEPENLAAQFSLSRIALAEGKTTLAINRLGVLLDSNPSYIPALVSLGMLLQDSNQLEALRPYAKNAVAVAPEAVATYIVLARLELALGRPDEALSVIEPARNTFPDVSELDHLHGVALLAQGKDSEALRSLSAAASSSSENPAYQFDLARAQLGNDRPEVARTTAENFCRMMPDDIRCPVLLGDIELALRNGSAALEHFDNAASIGWNRLVAVGLARARNMAGKGSTSAPLARWLQDHQEDHAVRLMYAQALESEGRVGEAIAEYETLHESGQLNAVGLNNLAWQYSQRGDQRAVKLAEKAHELAPGNPNITDTLGWILAQHGDYERAIPLLRQAAEQLPENEAIRRHLDEALRLSNED